MKYFLLILLAVFSQLFYAQSYERNYIGLAIGPSFAMSTFDNTNLSDSTSGFAKTGVGLVFNYSYRITHNFGVTAIINYSSNAFNDMVYADSLEQAHPDYNVSVLSDQNWSGGGILAGAFLSFPFSKNFSWDVRAAFGFYGFYSPRTTINTNLKEDPKIKAEYFRQRASAFSYAYSVGTGFKYALSRYYILLFVDYFNSPLQFDNASGWDWDDQPYTTKFKQDVSTLEATVGLGYFF